MERLRIQIGIESFVNGRRVARLTGVDRVVQSDPLLSLLVFTVVRELDAKDDQPGDGEVDIPLKDVPEELLRRVGGEQLAALLPGKENVFIRLTSAR